MHAADQPQRDGVRPGGVLVPGDGGGAGATGPDVLGDPQQQGPVQRRTGATTRLPLDQRRDSFTGRRIGRGRIGRIGHGCVGHGIVGHGFLLVGLP